MLILCAGFLEKKQNFLKTIAEGSLASLGLHSNKVKRNFVLQSLKFN